MGKYHFLLKFLPIKIRNRLREFGLNTINSFTFGYKTIILDGDKKIIGKFYKRPFLGYKDPIKTAIDVELKGYRKEYSIKKGDVVIDIGAFPGDFTVYASKLVGPKGLVISFEPDKANLKLLEKNIKLNKLNNVRLVKKGLWSKESLLKFICDGPHSKVFELDKKHGFSETIEVTTLDKFLKKENINKVNFIKMDIEGAEIEAVKGMKKTMKNNNVHFVIASYHKVNGEPTYKELEKFFKKQKYKVFTDYPEHLTTYACELP